MQDRSEAWQLEARFSNDLEFAMNLFCMRSSLRFCL
jgi:hypothetical protein